MQLIEIRNGMSAAAFLDIMLARCGPFQLSFAQGSRISACCFPDVTLADAEPEKGRSRACESAVLVERCSVNAWLQPP